MVGARLHNVTFDLLHILDLDISPHDDAEKHENREPQARGAHGLQRLAVGSIDAVPFGTAYESCSLISA